MRLRAPSYPLITVDPYFSVWSSSDRLTDSETCHWTSSPVRISGIAEIDGKEFRFIGASPAGIPAMEQTSVKVTAMSTEYTMEQSGVKLTLKFTTPLLPDDLYCLSRPVSYLEITRDFTDRHMHTVHISLSVSEEICTDKAGDAEIVGEVSRIGKYSTVRIGRKEQKILGRSGDNLRIEWGYFYLTGEGETSVKKDENGITYASIDLAPAKNSLLTFAYDDIRSICYFGSHLRSWWNKDGALIEDEIEKAHSDYRTVIRRCDAFDEKLFVDAVRAGGEKYAEMLELAFRQSVGAHKLAVDEDGEVIFISKECFSNGCAATVDVSYPSIPLFLLWNTELVKGMMRPVYRFASTDAWPYDFAPHDAGQYPLVNGQVYGRKKDDDGNIYYRFESQMPVEECGNMLLMETAVAVIDGTPAFAESHMKYLDTWVGYLLENGRDPADQLCTDDFAGHLAHNCNLSLKAIMGIAGYAVIKGMCGDNKARNKYLSIARSMAKDWLVRAANGDGSYRLAFDRPGSFSMKYNLVWDKLMGTELFPKSFYSSEVASYMSKMHPYGLDLDNRQPYTKSDWLVWTATLAESREDFERLTDPLWDFYNYTPSRVPMTDWYYTLTGLHKAYFSRTSNMEISFRNRTVIGGLFIKLLEYRGLMKI